MIARLVETTRDESARVRLVAARALGRTGDVAALGPLNDMRRGEEIVQIKLAAMRGIEGIEAAQKKA